MKVHDSNTVPFFVRFDTCSGNKVAPTEPAASATKTDTVFWSLTQKWAVSRMDVNWEKASTWAPGAEIVRLKYHTA